MVVAVVQDIVIQFCNVLVFCHFGGCVFPGKTCPILKPEAGWIVGGFTLCDDRDIREQRVNFFIFVENCQNIIKKSKFSSQIRYCNVI